MSHHESRFLKSKKIFGSEEPPLCSSLSSLCRGNANLLCIVPIFLMPTRRWQQYIHLVNVQFPLLRITEVKLERPAPSQLFFSPTISFFSFPLHSQMVIIIISRACRLPLSLHVYFASMPINLKKEEVHE